MRGLAAKRASVSRCVRLIGRRYGVGGRWRGGGGRCVAFWEMWESEYWFGVMMRMY